MSPSVTRYGIYRTIRINGVRFHKLLATFDTLDEAIQAAGVFPPDTHFVQQFEV